MKKLLKFLFLLGFISTFFSCVDEEEFDFDSLSQTTLNPTINAPLINTEILLSDFLDIEQLSDTAKGYEIIQVNEGNDSYLELVLSFKDSFNINQFIQQIQGVNDVSIELEGLNLPSLGDLGLGGLEIPDITFAYPDTSVAAEDISIEIGDLGNGIDVDSVQILSGGLNIQPIDDLPVTAYLEITSNTVRDRVTGELLHDTIQISNNTNSINQLFDLSNYTISLKDSTVNGTTKQFIDLKYRLIFNISGNSGFEGGEYDINLNVSLVPLIIDAIFGDLGETEFNVCDSVALEFFQDSVLNAITGSNSVDFETFMLKFSTSTNIGADMNIHHNIYTKTNDGQSYSLFPQNAPLHINGADVLGETGYTNDIILESDASAIEVFPETLVYDLDFDFRDEIAKQKSGNNFVSPDDAFVTLDAKAILPLKAKLKNLHYETDFDAFNFVEEMNYLKSTSLQFYIESTFPAELSVNLFLMDSNLVVFDTLLVSPFVIPGANIDSEGHTLSPIGKNISITLEDSKYESLKRASKIRLSATLNTSSDEQGQQQYVRFSNDAKIKIKASVSATGNIIF